MTAQNPASPKDRKGSERPSGELGQAVKGMSDGELRTLAGAVLSELKVRAPAHKKPGFAHERLVSDLQRRLADAHDYAQSGFGRQGGMPLPPARLSRRGSGALSGETKAKVLIGLEAELLPRETVAEDGATSAKPVPVTPARGAQDMRNGGAADPIDLPIGSTALEEEIRQALHRGVRKRGLPPPVLPGNTRR